VGGLLRLPRRGAIISMPSFSQLRIQRIAVIGAIADQVFRLGFDHVEVET
jgi:hypothetical protein